LTPVNTQMDNIDFPNTGFFRANLFYDNTWTEVFML